MALPERFFRAGNYADRPTLDANATGVMYYAEDTFQLLRWNGDDLDWDDIITNGGLTLSSADLTYLSKSANLSDLASASTSRDNLGLGSMAVEDTADWVPASALGAPSGVATLDGAGLIDVSQLPPLAINDTFVVASQAAMLALTAQRGDVAVRSDVNKTFILSTDSPGTLADWVEVLVPATVTSVAGRTGAVTLTYTDIGGLGTMATETATDYLTKAGNLSGLADAGTARGNLGLGTMAVETATDYLTKAGNLSGLANVGTARSNLGLGTAATYAYSAFEPAAGNPAADGYVWSSTSGGVRSWVPFTNPVGFASGNFVLSGGQVVYSGTGLQFNVAAAVYYIGGVQYTSAEQTVTLSAADATNPRIDVIYLDTTGTANKVTGTAAAAPTEPDIDPTTQVQLTFVQVPAAATSISAITNTTVYAENAGGEWVATTNVGGEVALASTNNPHGGTKDVEGTAVNTNTYVRFTSGTVIDLSNFNLLIFYIRNKAAWPSTRSITLRWFNASTAGQGVGITFKGGVYGFDSANTSGYQLIAIPLSAFQVPAGTSITMLQMLVTGSGTTLGFYIDDVYLQSGTAGGTTVGITQAFADARYTQLPVGKRATLTASSGALAASASANVSLDMLCKGWTLYSVTTDYPARVRGYMTSAQRTADADRASTTKATPNVSCLFDVKCGPGNNVEFNFSPAIHGYNFDGTAANTLYLAITNLDTVSRTVTATLKRVAEDNG